MEDIVIIQQPGTPATAEGMPPLQQIVEHFLFTQDVRPGSRNVYRRSLMQFFNWVDDSNNQLNSLTREHILAYKQYLIDKGLSPLTIGSYITTVKLFYQFTSINGIYKDIAKGIKLPRKPQGHRKQSLTVNEGRMLINYLSAQGPRNKAIGAILLNTGIRTIELSRLLIEDITMKQGKHILMIQGKGRDTKDRLITVNDYTYSAIKEYLSTRPKALPGEPLFPSGSNNSKGKPITTRTISYIIKEALRACGLDHAMFTAHCLRHTFATSLIRAGAEIYKVSKAMGHASINTTNVYIKTIEEEMMLEYPVTDILNNVYS